MTRVSNAVEHRFVVPGAAVSFRSPNSAAYKRRVRRIAQRVFPKKLTDEQIEVLIDYFHVTPRRMDMDNVAKCILDALNGVAYRDDRQVRQQRSDAHDLTRAIWLEAGPVDLVKPLRAHAEYVIVRVRELPRIRQRRRLGA